MCKQVDMTLNMFVECSISGNSVISAEIINNIRQNIIWDYYKCYKG